MHTVFVYGTLRTGASNHYRMRGARSLGQAQVFGHLYHIHKEFPGLVLIPAQSKVVIGEIFSNVTDKHLFELDRYEGCDASIPTHEQLYRRVISEVTLANGQRENVWMWEYVKATEPSQQVVSGDWLAK